MTWKILFFSFFNVLQDLDSGQLLNYERNVSDALSIFPSLQTGLDINVRFTGLVRLFFSIGCLDIVPPLSPISFFLIAIVVMVFFISIKWSILMRLPKIVQTPFKVAICLEWTDWQMSSEDSLLMRPIIEITNYLDVDEAELTNALPLLSFPGAAFMWSRK